MNEFQYIGTAFVGLGLLWTAGFLWAYFRAAGKATAAESWPTAMGRVVSSEVRVEESSSRDGATTTWYNPIVVYGYSVGGRQMQGSRLRFGNPRSASRKKADAAIAPYPAGGTVNVRYNPEKAEECVLETKKPGLLYPFMSAFGLLFAGFGFYFMSMA